MSLPAIEVSLLSKRYVIQHESRHDSLRDTLHHTARKLWRRFRWGTGFKTEEFWALRDVSFSVQPGEVVGIIGRNGAGKSTLLKILSRITEPTAGTVRLRGRVASLLEVGTGFHPELSGRENIFLNGAILGMQRAEIRKKFDEIVAFAEIERFLDTPVKRYSSGMYVRLAFAVAAHLEPEILIVDEVLAVGDTAFQKKCLGKMRDVAAEGSRTVIFVSHNMAAVQNLCSRALFLKSGCLAAQGETAEMLRVYSGEWIGSRQDADLDLSCVLHRSGEGGARFTRLRLADEHNVACDRFCVGQLLRLQLTLQTSQILRNFVIGFSINSQDGQVIACSNHYDTLLLNELPLGLNVLEVSIDELWLSPGIYSMTVAINREDHQAGIDRISEAGSFTVEPRLHAPGQVAAKLLDSRPGFIRRPLTWHLHERPSV